MRSGKAYCERIIFRHSSGIDQQVDILGQMLGDALDNVTTQEVEQAVADGRTQYQQGGAHGCRDINNRIGHRITYGVAGKNRVTVGHRFGLRENLAGLVVLLPAPALIGLAEGGQGANEQQIQRPMANSRVFPGPRTAHTIGGPVTDSFAELGTAATASPFMVGAGALAAAASSFFLLTSATSPRKIKPTARILTAKIRAPGLSMKSEISIASMMAKVQNISVRSHVAISTFLSVDVAPKFVAIAPTTPTA